MKLANLLKEGYKIIFEGYDHMSTWIVLEKNGEQFYYSFITETLERIDYSKNISPNSDEMKWDEYGNLLDECK
jgi:predicted deacetylase